MLTGVRQRVPEDRDEQTDTQADPASFIAPGIKAVSIPIAVHTKSDIILYTVSYTLEPELEQTILKVSTYNMLYACL